MNDFNSGIKWKYAHDITNTKKLFTHIDPTKHKFEWSDTWNIFTVSTDSSYLSVKHMEFRNARNATFSTS